VTHVPAGLNSTACSICVRPELGERVVAAVRDQRLRNNVAQPVTALIGAPHLAPELEDSNGNRRQRGLDDLQ
jgi:hypothetical protein